MTKPWGSDKLIRKEYDDSATSASIVWSAESGKIHVPVRLTATTEDATSLQVYHETNVAGNRLVNMYTSAGGGVAWQYDKDVAPEIPAGTDLYVKVGAGNVKVHIDGLFK